MWLHSAAVHAPQSRGPREKVLPRVREENGASGDQRVREENGASGPLGSEREGPPEHPRGSTLVLERMDHQNGVVA